MKRLSTFRTMTRARSFRAACVTSLPIRQGVIFLLNLCLCASCVVNYDVDTSKIIEKNRLV
ncbi:MAG: hypothetical protein LBG28_09850, partial [Tannerella sp.]|nr:hypothetical protein [Tannerella sp.]